MGLGAENLLWLGVGLMAGAATGVGSAFEGAEAAGLFGISAAVAGLACVVWGALRLKRVSPQ